MTDYSQNKKLKSLIKTLKALDMNTISFEKAFRILQKLKQDISEIDLGS